MRLLLAALFLGQCVLSSAATCYAPDGGEKTSNDIAPCSDDPSDPLSHVCCNMNRPKAPGTSTNASEIRDTCLPNGLCQNESLLKDGSVYLQWGRNFCTQRDWTTGQCLDNVCTNTVQGKAGSQRVIPCTGKNTSITWCCGDSDDCCTSDDQSNLVSLSPTFTLAAVPSSSSTSPPTTSTSTGSPTIASTSSVEPTSTSATSLVTVGSPSPTSKPTETPADSEGLSAGAKAGIAVGAVIGALLLVALGIWISKAMAWRKEAHAAKAHGTPGNYTPDTDAEGFYGEYSRKYAYYAEVDATTPPTEVLSTPDPVEAPDTQVGAPHNRVDNIGAQKYY